MFSFDFTQVLKKKLSKLSRKDKVLIRVFKRKVEEVINRDVYTINSYKNLRRPLQNYKRIHLNDKYILLFQVDIEKRFILFVDVKHWDKAYD